jgi:DNA-binding SARP family transcriptional activator
MGTSLVDAGVAHPAGIPNVLICLLGRFHVLKRGHAMSMRAGGRTQSLLAVLALGSRSIGIARDDLLEQLWPGSDEGLAVQSLRTLVYSLHRSLGDVLGGAGPVVHLDGRYRLNGEAGVVVDVDRFDSAVDSAERSSKRGETRDALDHYQDAVDIYAGDLVGGTNIQYLLERERLRTRYLSARAQIGEHHLAQGEYLEALRGATDILAHDPFREDAHRMAMRCYVRLGQRAQALRQYRICRDALAREFEAPPEPATETLHELVRFDPARV